MHRSRRSFHRPVPWLTSGNAGARRRVCPSRPWLHQSHLATALGLPACNFMAEKYTMSHSVSVPSWWRLAHCGIQHQRCFYFLSCAGIAQHIRRMLTFWVVLLAAERSTPVWDGDHLCLQWWLCGSNGGLRSSTPDFCILITSYPSEIHIFWFIT